MIEYRSCVVRVCGVIDADPATPFLMPSPIDPLAVAARIRCLTGLVEGAASPATIARTSGRLRVSEIGLRISIDEIQPHPSIEVLEALVREYRVDPSWLVTGKYNPDAHRRAVEEEAVSTHMEISRLLTPETGGAADLPGEASVPARTVDVSQPRRARRRGGS